MAIKFNRSQTFETNGTVTAAGLHNLIDGTDIYQALITDQTAMTSVGSLDKLLIADSDLTASDAPRSVTVNELFEDALTLSTYTNVQATNSFYTNATGNYTRSTGATITNGTIANGTIANGTITNGTIASGTIPTLTAGTTTSTAANITNGTVQTLTASTANISQGSAILTQGTIATFNSTTGTITNLSATTSTFLGTITGSTNVVNIGSGQLYKDASGNVGIGTTSPIGKLDVYGVGSFQNLEIGKSGQTGNRNASIDLTGDDTYTDYGCRIIRESAGSNANTIINTRGTGGLYLTAVDAGFIALQTTNTERMRIDSSGNVGIGTTTPVNKLEVVGSFGRGAPVTKTADFTLAATENWIIVNKAASTCTVTLPAASSWAGREFTIKTLQAFTVVSASSNVVPKNSVTPGTAILAAAAGNWATLVSDGISWWVMAGS